MEDWHLQKRSQRVAPFPKRTAKSLINSSKFFSKGFETFLSARQWKFLQLPFI